MQENNKEKTEMGDISQGNLRDPREEGSVV